MIRWTVNDRVRFLFLKMWTITHTDRIKAFTAKGRRWILWFGLLENTFHTHFKAICFFQTWAIKWKKNPHFPLISHCFTSSTAQWKSWSSSPNVRKGRRYLALYPCHVCTLAWPPIVVQGPKVALWCDKWFTVLADINKLFIQDSGQEVPPPHHQLQMETLKKKQ